MFCNTTYFICVFIFIPFLLHSDSSLKIIDIKKKSSIARKECIKSYNTFFAAYHKKITTLSSTFPDNITDLLTVNHSYYKRGSALLSIIHAFEEKKYLIEDRNYTKELITLGDTTLSKISEIFCLKLLCIMCSFDCPKSINRSLISSYYSLFNTTITHNGSVSFPFHTVLAELAITILMIKFNNLSYKTKKESLVFNLEIIKKKIIETNNTLDKQAIYNVEIANLVELLEQYSLKKPMVSSDKVNFFAKTTIAILLIGGIICYAINKGFPKWAKKKFTEIFGGYFGKDYLGQSTIEAIKKDLKLETVEKHLQSAQKTVRDINKTVKKIIDTVDDQNSHLSKTTYVITDTVKDISNALREKTPFVKAINNIADGLHKTSNMVNSINWKGVGMSVATVLAGTALHTMGIV